MRYIRSFITAFAATAVFASMVFAQPPTLADAQGAFNAKDYRLCLRNVADALSGPEGKVGSPTRYDLLALRGEAMIHLGEWRMATDAFRSASLIAKSKQDRERQAGAMASAMLITAAKKGSYTPAGGSSEPIDIVEPESRKKALAALLADRLAKDLPKIEQGAKSDSIPAIQDLLPQVRDLYALELAATGKSEKVMPAARALGEHVRDLLQAEFARIDARLDELSAAAATPVLAADVLTPRGLTSPERDELKALATPLAQSERAAQQGRLISRRTDGPTGAWDALLADCSELRTRAQELWDRRY